MSLTQALTGINPKHLIYGCGVALVLFVCWFFYQTGYKAAENKYLAEQADAVEDAIEDHNEDAAANRETAVEVREKIKYVDRVVYETVTQTITAECPDGAAELNGLLSVVVAEANSRSPVHTR